MKSTFEEETYEDCSNNTDSPKFVQCVSTTSDLISPEEVLVKKVEIYQAERWSDVTSLPDDAASVSSPPDDVEILTSPPCEIETVMSDTAIINETASEMYYTASSEVSLLSDMEIPEKVQEEDSSDERKECVIAGHVAAMRERFESMTRTNTPCPDLIRSMSPSLEVFRNITPSPDRLG